MLRWQRSLAQSGGIFLHKDAVVVVVMGGVWGGERGGVTGCCSLADLRNRLCWKWATRKSCLYDFWPGDVQPLRVQASQAGQDTADDSPPPS